MPEPEKLEKYVLLFMYTVKKEKYSETLEEIERPNLQEAIEYYRVRYTFLDAYGQHRNDDGEFLVALRLEFDLPPPGFVETIVYCFKLLFSMLRR